MLRLLSFLLASALLAGCAPGSDQGTPPQLAERAADAGRPTKWAQPVALPSVPNLHKVSDGLYRSAQPTAEGMQGLKKMGIKTVLNLRLLHSDRDEIGTTGLAYEHVQVEAWDADEDEVVRFLQIVTDPERAPVLVHCKHGSDRTGMMCAIYRVAVCGWSKEDAVEEMAEGGFGFHGIWDNLLDYVEGLDIPSIKEKAGIHEGKAEGVSPVPAGD